MRTLFASVCLAFLAAAASAATGPVRVLYLDAAGAERWTAMEGGCPIIVDGECIGGIGVAGGDFGRGFAGIQNPQHRDQITLGSIVRPPHPQLREDEFY